MSETVETDRGCFVTVAAGPDKTIRLELCGARASHVEGSQFVHSMANLSREETVRLVALLNEHLGKPLHCCDCADPKCKGPTCP